MFSDQKENKYLHKLTFFLISLSASVNLARKATKERSRRQKSSTKTNRLWKLVENGRPKSLRRLRRTNKRRRMKRADLSGCLLGLKIGPKLEKRRNGAIGSSKEPTIGKSFMTWWVLIGTQGETSRIRVFVLKYFKNINWTFAFWSAEAFSSRQWPAKHFRT